MSQLEIEVDEFLGRRGGKRKRLGLGKDAALGYYLKNFPKEGILIFHTKFSNNAFIPITTFKTLSRFLGAYTIPSSVNMIIFIERRVALDVFGNSCGFISARAGYFLSYTAYALALGITDPKQLTPYGKHFMLRYREPEKKDTTLLEYAQDLKRKPTL